MYVKIAAIGGITVLAVVASFHGIDGVLIGAAMGVIGGIAGYTVGITKKKG